MKCDILIAGVGGQGTVLASRILAAAAMEAGFFTRTSETIGMAQRGGCVISHVRIDSEDFSSIIPIKDADLLIGFEMAEAARNLYRLSENGKCIINTMTVKPVTSTLGNSNYDIEGIRNFIKSSAPDYTFVDGYNIAKNAGSVKAVNMVLLGAAASKGIFPFSNEVIKNAIIKNVSSKFADMNLKAFNLGFSINS